MIKPVPQPDWSESWRKSFACDRKEVFGDCSDPHYTILYQNRPRRVLDMVKRHARQGAKILDLPQHRAITFWRWLNKVTMLCGTISGQSLPIMSN